MRPNPQSTWHIWQASQVQGPKTGPIPDLYDTFHLSTSCDASIDHRSENDPVLLAATGKNQTKIPILVGEIAILAC